MMIKISPEQVQILARERKNEGVRAIMDILRANVEVYERLALAGPEYEALRHYETRGQAQAWRELYHLLAEHVGSTAGTSG